jgi:hypothetical protein
MKTNGKSLIFLKILNSFPIRDFFFKNFDFNSNSRIGIPRINYWVNYSYLKIFMYQGFVFENNKSEHMS